MWTRKDTFKAAVVALLGSTAVGLVFALPQISEPDLGWPNPLLTSLGQWWSWGLVALMIVAADSSPRIARHGIRLRFLVHVPLSLVLTLVYLFVFEFARVTLGVVPEPRATGLEFLGRALRMGGLWNLLVYWLILAAWWARQYHQRFRESELERERTERLSTEARLHALRLQLDPHFLFNALNTISSQVEANPKLARTMIQHLGDLLRLSLQSKGAQKASLIDELAFLEHYLAIQRVRFGDRIRFDLDVSPEAKFALVPAMTIQPLVENSIRHGISKRAVGGMVHIGATRIGDQLRIVVADDGVGFASNPAHGDNGMGLSITRQRLQGMYTDWTLEIRPRSGCGTEVEVRVPFEASQPTAA